MLHGILFILLILSLLFFVIGLISPKVSLFWLEKRSRLKSTVIFLMFAFLCLIVMIVLPNGSSIESESEVANSEVDSFTYWMNAGDQSLSDFENDSTVYRNQIYCYGNAIRHSSNSYLAYGKRGISEGGLALYLTIGNGINTDSSEYFFKQAIQDIDSYLASGDTTIEAACFDVKGTCLNYLKQYRGVIEIYTYLIYLKPNDVHYYKMRAAAYYSIFEVDSAMADILIAKSLRPQDEDINRIFLRLQSEM
jgi:tetratricopeptide (TPR) repeat protein